MLRGKNMTDTCAPIRVLSPVITSRPYAIPGTQTLVDAQGSPYSVVWLPAVDILWEIDIGALGLSLALVEPNSQDDYNPVGWVFGEPSPTRPDLDAQDAHAVAHQFPAARR
jgi:hypothetical protein